MWRIYLCTRGKRFYCCYDRSAEPFGRLAGSGSLNLRQSPRSAPPRDRLDCLQLNSITTRARDVFKATSESCIALPYAQAQERPAEASQRRTQGDDQPLVFVRVTAGIDRLALPSPGPTARLYSSRGVLS